MIRWWRLGALLGARWERLDLGDCPAHLVDRFRADYVRSGHEAFFRTARLEAVLDVLCRNVDVVLLKGAALSLTLYEVAAHRTMSDIDLLCRSKEDLQRVVQLLEGLGYRADTDDTPPDHHHQPPMVHRGENICIELHLNLTLPRLPQPTMDELWARRVPLAQASEKGWLMLDAPSRLIHQCLHAIADPLDSAVLRDLLEIGWMAATMSDAEAASFRNLVQRCELVDRVGRALWLAHDLWRTPTLIDRPPISAYEATVYLALRFSRDRSQAGNLGRHLGLELSKSMQRGGSPRNPFSLLAPIARSELRRLGQTRRRRRLREHVYELGTSSWRSSPINQHLLVHDRQGDVHLLKPTLVRLWERLVDEHRANPHISGQELEAFVRAGGVPPEQVSPTLEMLMSSGALELVAAREA